MLRVVLYFGTAHGLLLSRDNFYFYPHFGVDMKGQPVTGRWVDRFLSDAQQNLAARGESWRSTLTIIYRRGEPVDTLTGSKRGL